MKFIIDAVLIILLFIPINQYYSDEIYTWKNSYLVNDNQLILMLAPFYIFWIFNRIFKTKWINYILLGLSFLYLVNSFGGLTMPIQDFQPHIGILILALLFPIELIITYTDIKIRKAK